jgi:hypothetical protein
MFPCERFPVTPTPRAVRGDFINKAACRKYIMDVASKSRHHTFTRLAPEIYDELNGVLRRHMAAIVSRNPSFGKTIR